MPSKKIEKRSHDTPRDDEGNANISPLFIVGIGASAGGLEALRELLANLEYDLRLTYVITQHLSPTHPSMLKAILVRECKLAVVELTDACIPEANTIYITPPDKDVEIRNGVLHLLKPKLGVGPKPSINRFFASLAEDQTERAIGIILSGTGGDGARGMLSIRSAGGTTFVQQPETAKYDGMPNAAIQANAADAILPAGKIPAALASFVNSGVLVPRSEGDEADDIYDRIISVTRDVSGFNLAQYKRSTVERRIRRRMALYQIGNLEAYYDCIKSNQDEVNNFAKDVLISVTEFFRDAHSFDALGVVIDKLVGNSPAGQPLRVWVPGCATGEEAYSITILFEEAIRKTGKNRSYQVFATDVDASATNRGRAGRYPVAAFDKMPEALRDRYFEPVGGDFVASKLLRERIVFSVHNLIQDPPFSRVDLVSCRNLLIYFTPTLQKRVMEIFHYALNPNAILFLGKSETVGQHEDLYAAIDKQKRIYRKLGDRRVYRPFSTPPDVIAEKRSLIVERPKNYTVNPLEYKFAHALQQAYGPPTIVISSNDEIVHIGGDVSRFLRFKSGPTGLNIYELVDDSLRAELRALVYKCRRETVSVVGARHVIKNESGEQAVRLAVRPLDAAELGGLLLVSFEPAAERPAGLEASPGSADERDNPIILELEHELASTREHLQTVVEELETSNEELQSLNEELQSANEELQSTNEELQTSNEELQSTNEELLTVNDELQVKSRELELTAADLQNIQDSVDFPLIVVDERLRVTRFVPAINQLFPISEIHHGDEILALPWGGAIPRFRQMLMSVVKTGKTVRTAVEMEQRFFLMCIVPYRAREGALAGAVVLFPDTTEQHQAKLRAEQSEQKLQQLLDHLVDGVIAIDDRNKVITFNKSAERIFGYSAKEVVGRSVTMLMPESESVKHNHFVQGYVKTGKANAIGRQREVIAKDKSGRLFPLELSVDEMITGKRRIFTAVVRDITERKAMENALFGEKERALVTLHSIADGVITTTREGQVDYLNPVAKQMTGYSGSELGPRHISQIFRVVDEGTREAKNNIVRDVIERGEPVILGSDSILRSLDGREYAIELSASPIRNREGEIVGVVIVFHDVTEKFQILRQMTWQARHDPLTGLVNRKEMEARIEFALTSAKSFKRQHALLYIDLDQFKIVNDTCGHQAGDEMLRQIAGHLGAGLRQRDALSRFGGDEFAVLLENCSLAQAQRIAEAIQEQVEEYRFIWDEKVFKVGASIGVVAISDESIDVAQVLRDADSACYAAKDAGRNRVQIHTPDDAGLQRQRREMHWVSNINQVLEGNRFRLYFQKIESLQSASVGHWEVLLRMLDENEEVVLPGVFLPAAERYGQMQNIDRWVVRSALSVLEKTPIGANKAPPVFAINISAASLCDEKFLKYVKQQFDAFKVSPSQVCFEITETAAIANFAKAKDFIHAMKKLDCQFALDDFGSGMSSFGYLKSLAVDYIKVDGIFVRNINHDIVDLAMVESINRIGNLMGLEVIAECAESEAVLTTLKQIGIAYAQGYGVQRPLKSEDFLMAV